jgi:GTP-binding protein Era
MNKSFVPLTAAFESKFAALKASKLSALMARNFRNLEQHTKEKFLKFIEGPRQQPSYAFMPFGSASETKECSLDSTLPLHSACVAVIGAANAGKSTLVNHLIGSKCLPVSSKAQTTRNATLAVKTQGNFQVVFVDTPGFSPEYSISNLPASLADANALLYVVDVSKPFFSYDWKVAVPRLAASCPETIPVALVLNKIDKCSEERLLRIKADFSTKLPMLERIFCTNALHKNKDVLEVEKWILSKNICKPVKEFAFPSVNQPVLTPIERVLECLREKIYKRYNAEVPYMAKVEVVSWKEPNPKTLCLAVDVAVPRQSHQLILLGSKGEALNWVREKTQQELSDFFQKNVHLFIRVVVSANK